MFASKVEREVTVGAIRLDFDEEDEVNPTNKTEVELEVISIVAKDTETDSTRCLVHVMQNV